MTANSSIGVGRPMPRAYRPVGVAAQTKKIASKAGENRCRNLSNKTAVVTGAASGIGLELAKVFAEQGMNVVLADIEQTKLDDRCRRSDGTGRRGYRRADGCRLG